MVVKSVNSVKPTDSFDVVSPVKMKATLGDYLAIARLDHVTKHIFIFPGIGLAYVLRGPHTDNLALSACLGFVTALCIASANYVINEWLDREFDKHHPSKSARKSVQKNINGRFVWLEWVAFGCIGLLCAFINSWIMFGTACVFLLQGIVYNVPPIRTKNLAYLDVISEAINNPLRLMIGWSIVDPTTLPPSSIIIAYWTGGAFLMAAKRMSEFREIVAAHGRDLLVRYRASFSQYSEISLMVSCFAYALISSFVLGVFLVKYRIEYILMMPVLIAMFCEYLALSMKPESSAQKPEKLYQERGLILLLVVLTAVFVVSTAFNFHALDVLTSQRYLSL